MTAAGGAWLIASRITGSAQARNALPGLPKTALFLCERQADKNLLSACLVFMPALILPYREVLYWEIASSTERSACSSQNCASESSLFL